MVRAHRAELHAYKALTRIGRGLVFLGDGYQKFLNGGIARVIDYGIAPNAPEHAHKRNRAFPNEKAPGVGIPEGRRLSREKLKRDSINVVKGSSINDGKYKTAPPRSKTD
jgi:hypothetical protein